MANKTGNSKKGGFTLAPISLSEPVKATDGFTNLVETLGGKEAINKPEPKKGSDSTAPKKREQVKLQAAKRAAVPKLKDADAEKGNEPIQTDENSAQKEIKTTDLSMTESELLRILDADSLDEIYELSDVLRASSLKLYATLVQLADSRGRARVKNHELMSKAGIKGIATLYKQERWLMDLKLLEKKAKPGPHDGSSYVVHKLEILPLPDEIYEKFDEYLSSLK